MPPQPADPTDPTVKDRRELEKKRKSNEDALKKLEDELPKQIEHTKRVRG